MVHKVRNFMGRNYNKVRSEDKISPQKRSEVMSKIRSKNTHFESEFLKEFNKRFTHRYVKNYSKVRGKPDIAILSKKICIFLDSDFWHGWQFPRWKHLLKNDFWRNKINNNRKRDKRTTNYLRRKGWTVIRIWEHQIKQSAEDIVRNLPLK